MQSTERSTVVGVFTQRSEAERAIDELHRAGFTDEQIGFVVQQGEHTGTEMKTDTGGNAGEGAVGGMLAGAGIGGLLAAAAALLIPGFGPVLAGGILATALGGAAVGAAAGGILGALVGAGVPEEEARYYESEFQQGRILVTVKADGRRDEAHAILHRYGAYDMEHPERLATADTAGTTTTEGSERIQLHEEELHARTRPVEAGEVRVTKDVVEEQQQIEVPVRREEVYVERRPVDRPATDADFQSDEIRVPVMEEQVQVDKTAVVREEIEVGKRAVQETEHVSDTVRREEAHVERTGDVPVHGWEEVSPSYRQAWQTRYGTSGGRWEDSEPGYRYGYEMAQDPRYAGREWNEVESDLHRGYASWGQRHGYTYGENDWDRFKDGVREAWESARGQRRAA